VLRIDPLLTAAQAGRCAPPLQFLENLVHRSVHGFRLTSRAVLPRCTPLASRPLDRR
jgi:hypothetical protein